MNSRVRRLAPLLALVVAFIASQQLWRLELILTPVESEVPSGAVALYGTAWCNYCARARSFLEANDIPFADFDIEHSPAAAQAFQRLGGRGVPLVRIGDRVVHGFAPGEMRRALEKLAH